MCIGQRTLMLPDYIFDERLRGLLSFARACIFLIKYFKKNHVDDSWPPTLIGGFSNLEVI